MADAEEEKRPGYHGGSTKPGVGVNIPQTGDTQLPPNTRFEIPQGGVPSGWTVTVYSDNRMVIPTLPTLQLPVIYVDITDIMPSLFGSVEITTSSLKFLPNHTQNYMRGLYDGIRKLTVAINIPPTSVTRLLHKSRSYTFLE
ncbi:hypothetical protein DOS63_04890, partial [Staphylococcus felis]|uniref:hypothetical protein n=1 Tax=Staphylococcus felis TaxID=46127 RepID=UPI000E3865DD